MSTTAYLKSGFVLLLTCLLAYTASAQYDNAKDGRFDHGLYTRVKGYYGGNFHEYGFLDGGLALRIIDRSGQFNFASYYAMGCEIKPHENHLPIWGPKMSVWFDRGVSFGVSGIYYFNVLEHSWRIRPEIGWGGFEGMKFSYGYNIPLYNKDMAYVNRHVFTIAFFVPNRGFGRKRGWRHDWRDEIDADK